MAKVSITGKVAAVISDISLENIKVIEKFRPQALSLFEGEGKEKTIVFRIASGNTDCISNNGIVFTAKVDDGRAVVCTMLEDAEKAKDIFAEKFGVAILNLRKLEAQIPAVLEEIKAERDAVMAAIDVQ